VLPFQRKDRATVENQLRRGRGDRSVGVHPKALPFSFDCQRRSGRSAGSICAMCVHVVSSIGQAIGEWNVINEPPSMEVTCLIPEQNLYL
jgi:hypothetical protein